MKWFEVVSGCDGYYTPKRFRTEQAAENYVQEVDDEHDDVHVSEGPYEVNTDDSAFWYVE